MSDLVKLSAKAMLDGMAAKKFSALELAEAHIVEAEKASGLNALITTCFDQTRDMAKDSDARRSKGEVGQLEGLPIAVKDLFCTKGQRTTAGSNILSNFVPTYESTVTDKLWQAGALLLGKANLDEFAMGSSNESSAYGPVISPWRAQGSDENLVPGGSSGGSSAAVAAEMVPLATGTDTGGSIRQPAAYCGIVGVKPTYGRCSRWGIIAYASSLDQAGAFARNVEDAALMLEVMTGHDPRDSTSVNLDRPSLGTSLTQGVKGLRVGIPKEYRVEGMSQEIEKLWQNGMEWLKAEGAEIIDISLPHTATALPTYYIIAMAECSSNLARYDGVRFGQRVDGASISEMYENTRGAGFGRETRRRILLGTYVLSAGYYDAYYLKAQKVRALIAQDFKQAFETVDVILTPTAPSSAFAIGAKTADPIEMYLNDVFTVPASLAGLPGISVPAGLSGQGLPLGLQLLAKPFDEPGLFRAAAALERAAGPVGKPQKWWRA